MGGEFSLGDIVANVKANISDFQAKMGIVRDEAESSGSSLGQMALVAGAVAAGFMAVKAGVDFASSSLKDFGEEQVAMAQISQVLQSTGKNASLSADQVHDLAMKLEEYSGQSHVAIEQGQTLLLQFSGITNDTLPAASRAMVDLAQRMGVDTVTAAKTLGIAIDDPTTGMSRLRRVGIDFTEDQKTAIKALKDSGDTAGAASLLMQVLETKVGGAAGAFRTTLPGAMAAASNNLNDFKETVGKTLSEALTPLVEKFNNWFDRMGGASGVLKLITEDIKKITPYIESLAIVVGVLLLPVIWGLVTALGAFLIESLPIIAVILALGFVIAHWGDITKIFHLVIKDIQKTWKDWTTDLDKFIHGIGRDFTNWFNDSTTFVKNVWNDTVNVLHKGVDDIVWFFTHLPYEIGFALGAIVRFFVDFYTVWVPNFVNGVISWFVKLPGEIGKALEEMWKIISSWFTKTSTDTSKTTENLVNNVVSWFAQLPGRIGTWIANTWNSASEAFSNFGRNANQWASNTINDVVHWFNDLPNRILQAISGLGNLLLNKAKDIAGSFWQGFKNGLGIHSPSYVEQAFMNIANEGKKTVSAMQDNMQSLNSFAASAALSPSLAQNIANSSQNWQTNVNGPINISSSGDADYFFKRLSRGQELAKLRIPVPPGGIG